MVVVMFIFSNIRTNSIQSKIDIAERHVIPTVGTKDERIAFDFAVVTVSAIFFAFSTWVFIVNFIQMEYGNGRSSDLVYPVFALFMIVSFPILLWGIVKYRHDIRWAFKRWFRRGYRLPNPT
jgi:hypothetical protein